jgi:SAM-dependent methyltransferase
VSVIEDAVLAQHSYFCRSAKVTHSEIEKYLIGSELYGDDFDEREISEWFDAEKEGYADLGAKDHANYRYEYHALNTVLGFDRLAGDVYENVLGFGSAYGDELEPIASKVNNVVVVDPSDHFESSLIFGKPVQYVKPSYDAKLPFESDHFDLITCFGVLHHIPNVSATVAEFARVLKPGGCLLVREPIVSMGDWRFPRRGLTKRERGIPFNIFANIVESSGLKITNSSLCNFPVSEAIGRLFVRDIYNSRFVVRLDQFMSWAFRWNLSYHPVNFWKKFRPTSAFLIAEK